MSGTHSRPSIVARTVTVVGDKFGQARPLTDFQSECSYVLLGDPGAGKTTALRMEAEADPNGLLVTARGFTRRRLDRHPEWRGKTLFIDGLDEVRAGRPDARTPVDAIVDRLERLGSPKFRLSCRSADWLGRNDREQIVATTGYGGTPTLHLEPLADEDVHTIVKSLCGGDPEAFLSKASDCGLGGMLRNPHLLKLLVRAVRHGKWPDGRMATVEQACKMWVREHNEDHRAAHRNARPVSIEDILEAAGRLCALLLLSDRDYVSLDETGDANSLPLGDVRGGGREGYGFALRRALRSPLFIEYAGGGRMPAHRQIAEFLAARHLDARIESGLPASRALALMAGFDGVIVSELRGLGAWLAAFNASVRARLIALDPVGVALYGDAGTCTKHERERLLRAFAKRADEISVRDWPEAALTSLVDSYTPRILAAYLRDDDRSEGTQEVVHLLLAALSRASVPLPPGTALVAAIRDGSWRPRVRSMALRGLLRRRHRDPSCLPDLMSLLDDLRGGRVRDRDHELLGLLLWHLYPDHIGPASVWDYLLPDELPLGGSYGSFWRSRRGTEWLDAGPASPPPRSAVATVREEAAEYQTEAERERSEVVAVARGQLEQLRDGTCAPALLNRLAVAYHNPFDDQPGADPQSRLLEFFEGDRELTQAALEGFRRALDRDDLPNLRDMIRLDENNRMSFFSLPLLAGLDLLGSTALQGRDAAASLRAVGTYYITPINPNQATHPAWYAAIREARPEVVAEALVKVTRSRIRRKRDCHYLWRLARDPAYRKVTRIAAPQLWRGFPIKCTEPQILALRELLRAGVRWRVDGIEEALRRRIDADLDVAQRALWLSAGLLVSPEEYAPFVVSFVEGGEEARVRHVVDFLVPAAGAYRLPMPWGTSELQSLLTLVGRRYEPWMSETTRSSPWTDGSRMKAEQLIHRWVRRLAARTDDASIAALESLVSDASLRPWRTVLRRGADAQMVACRSARFTTPSLDAVQRTLSGGPPASAADLCALVAIALEDIGEHLRRGDTDGWQQCWHEPTCLLQRAARERLPKTAS